MIEDKKVVEIDNVEAETPTAISLDLSETARTNIWINGDCTKVIRLNLTDMNIMTRAKDAQAKLEELQAEANKMASVDIPKSIDTEEDEEKIDKAIEVFRVIDEKMRDLVDGIFDYPVCDVCCDGGSMYDPINGQYRYEYIIDKLMALYGDSWEKESKKHKAQMRKHTAKYTTKRKK
jgi:hypothetical protein